MTRLTGMSTEAFRQRRNHSILAVEAVARWCERRGADVYLPDEPAIVEGGRDHDNGDLYVNGSRVEVKWRTLHFTGLDDFPFRHCYLCAVHQWEQADPPPSRFVIVDRDLTGMLVFKVTHTRPLWQEVTVYNALEGRENRMIQCPVAAAEYVVLA